MLLVKYYFPFDFPSLRKLSFDTAWHSAPSLISVSSVDTRAPWPLMQWMHLNTLVFLLYMLKTLITNASEHHWLRAFYSSHRSANRLCRTIWKGQHPCPWEQSSSSNGPRAVDRGCFGLSRDKSKVCYTSFPRAFQQGWAPLAQSAHWLHDTPFTGFFPFLASLPYPLLMLPRIPPN